MGRLSCIQDGLVARENLLSSVQLLITVFGDAQELIRHAAILKALEPPAATAREDDIKTRHPRTLDWILNRRELGEAAVSTAGPGPYTDFVKWLREGSGVYHVVGKPGSGKSTLMKFLVNEPSVRNHLETWAASAKKQLILSKFFFWKYGSDDQKSARGLFRGLLYEICKDSMAVTKTLFPRLWGDAKTWQFPGIGEVRIKGEEIKNTLRRLRTDKDIRDQFRICLFVDDLDEFDGVAMSLFSMAKDLRAWTQDSDSTGFLKICISSREEHPILSAFPARQQRIYLQDMTREDIRDMITGTLGANEYFLRLQQEDKKDSDSLIASIITNAEGVFLWVALPLNLLEDELSSGISSITNLRRIVRSSPKELEEFLDQILNSIISHHKRGAYFISSVWHYAC